MIRASILVAGLALIWTALIVWLRHRNRWVEQRLASLKGERVLLGFTAHPLGGAITELDGVIASISEGWLRVDPVYSATIVPRWQIQTPGEHRLVLVSNVRYVEVNGSRIEF